MTELSEELKQAIWHYVDGEVDAAEEQKLLAMASENEIIAQAIRTNQNLDSLITSAVRAKKLNEQTFHAPCQSKYENKSTGSTSRECTNYESLVGKIKNAIRKIKTRKCIGRKPTSLLSVWPCLTGTAAVLAFLLLGVLYTAPNSNLSWSPTEIILLGQTRSADSFSQSNGLDQPSIRNVCSDLRKSIDLAYADAMGKDGREWDLKLAVVEHAKGAFEVQVDAQAKDHEKITIAEERHYQSVSAFEADLEYLCKATVSALQGGKL